MRKGHSGLTMLITQKTSFEITEGSLFLFISKNRRTLKGIYFDRTGSVLVHKKLEAGRFMSFEACRELFEVDSSEFEIIFHGGDLPLTSKGKRIRLQVA